MIANEGCSDAMIIEDKFEQPDHRLSPIDTTLSGNVILVRLVHVENASLEMLHCQEL